MSTPSYSEHLGVSRPDVASLVDRYRQEELKMIDLLVAVLLERGGPVPVEEAAARLEEVGVSHWREDLGMVLKRSMAPCPEVVLDADGRFALSTLDPSDRRLRRRLDNLDPPPPPSGSGGLTQERFEEMDREWRAREAAEREEAAALRRVLVHGVFEGGELRAVALLDPQAREIETFAGEELATVPELLARFDLVIGIAPGRLLEALGVAPDAFRLADVDRPQKTRQVDQWSRPVRLTNEMLIGSTLGRSGPLGEESKYREYLEKGHLGRLGRRLEADVKALWVYYRFGVLHRAVRLRQRSVDDWIPAEWALPGDPGLQTLVREAFENGKFLQVVAGGPAAWPDPWERSTFVEAVQRGPYEYALRPVSGEPAAHGAVIYEARQEQPPEGMEVEAGGRVRLQLPLGERDLILQHCIALVPDLERRLKLAPIRSGRAIELALDAAELDDLLSHVAFAANYADDPELQDRLDVVYERLAIAERWAQS